MEQILAFVLGIGVAFLVWGVVVIFRTVNKVKKLETDLQHIINTIDENRRSTYEQDLALHNRIDQEIERVNQLANNIYSAIDSRLDKMETRLKNEQGSKQVLKG